MSKLQFKGEANWFTVDGELYRLWLNNDSVFINNRSTPIQTEISTVKGEWNGKIVDVQHTKFEGWYIQFLVNETYMHPLSDMQSCESISLEDPINNINHTFNVDVLENLEVTFEPTDNGTLFICSIIYRAKKIIIPKGDPTLNTNAIRITNQSDVVLPDYFTDFEILPYVGNVDETTVNVSNGQERTSRKVTKSGVSALLYYSTDDLVDFEKQLYDAKKIEIVESVSGSPIVHTSLDLDSIEKAQAGENYNRIALKFITEEKVTEELLNSNETNELLMDAFSFYTDNELIVKTEQGDNVNISLPSGQEQIGAAIIKEGVNFTSFLENATLADFLKRYQNSDVIKVGPNGGLLVDVLERRQVTERELNDTQKEVNLFCVTAISRKYFNLNPLNTHALIITRTGQPGSPWTFNTDFPLKPISQDPDIETTDNEEGVEKSVKNITKFVTEVKFYVDETTAFSIKENFELGGTMTIDAVSILEARPVEPEELAPDLYEVVVECLTDTDLFYPDKP